MAADLERLLNSREVPSVPGVLADFNLIVSHLNISKPHPEVHATFSNTSRLCGSQSSICCVEYVPCHRQLLSGCLFEMPPECVSVCVCTCLCVCDIPGLMSSGVINRTMN